MTNRDSANFEQNPIAVRILGILGDSDKPIKGWDLMLEALGVETVDPKGPVYNSAKASLKMLVDINMVVIVGVARGAKGYEKKWLSNQLFTLNEKGYAWYERRENEQMAKLDEEFAEVNDLIQRVAKGNAVLGEKWLKDPHKLRVLERAVTFGYIRLRPVITEDGKRMTESHTN